MALIKNLTTGNTMECLNADVIAVCKKDANFVVSEKAVKKPTKSTVKKAE